jgi:transcriptional regulator with XRE-family HTH domain
MVMEDIVAEVGKKIVALREARGIRREEAAQALGLAYGRLSKYEQGIREPDMATLKRIADYFNVSLDYLYDRPESPEWIDRFPPDLRDWLLNITSREFLLAVKAMWDDGIRDPHLLIAYANLLKQAREPKKDS